MQNMRTGRAALAMPRLNIRAADGGGAFGAERQGFAAAVFECAGFLIHDVGRRADACLEKPGVLERRRRDAPVPNLAAVSAIFSRTRSQCG